MFLFIANWNPVALHFSSNKNYSGNNGQTVTLNPQLYWWQSIKSTLNGDAKNHPALIPHALTRKPLLSSMRISFTAASIPSVQDAGLTASQSLLTIIPVGNEPYSQCFDLKSGNIYVSNAGSANVSVINSTTEKVIGTINLTGDGNGIPSEIVYDPSNNHVYVSGFNYFVSINASDNKIDLNMQTGFITNSLMYYPPTAGVYAGGDNGSLYEFNTSSHLLFPVLRLGKSISSLAFDNSTDRIFAGYQSSGNISVLEGNPLSLTRNFTSRMSGVSDIVYSAKIDGLYISSALDGSVALLNATSGVTDRTIYVGGTPFQLTLYDNSSRILVAGGSVDVLDSSSLSNLSSLSSTKGYQFGRVMIDNGGKACFIDENNSIAVLNIKPSVSVFEVSFAETGLHTGTEWAVNLDDLKQSSTSNLIAFYAVNGSYKFAVAGIHSYSISPMTGIIMVSGGMVNQVIAFRVNYPLYAVSVISHGLPTKVVWSVTIRSNSNLGYPYNMTFTTYNHTIDTNLSNGSYVYSLGRLNDFTPNSDFGYILVNGTAATVYINWTKNPTNFLTEKLFGIPIVELIQFSMVAAIILGSVLMSRVIRKNKR